ncbi:MFS transporter [Streptomyces sp. NPDC007861]|uniref:MFS transporter n=1 Tax=Streptomyces sp. NPDC007861 TaxID=3154893 RepID=UPI0033D596F5
MAYREIITRPVLTWGTVAVGARLPVAAAPLALVFLVRERPGGYTLGAVLAAVYVVGEIVGAPLLGMRMRPERARPQLAAGLAAGAAGFGALGVAHDAHPVLLGVFAFVAGAGPAAAPGGMRALLTSLVPERAAAQAMSLESVLTFGIWAVAPALTAALALGTAPHAPLLLVAALMAASVAGLWALPAGWATGDDDAGGGGGTLRVVLGAWPVYVAGAASMTLLALAELILPALLEQRGIAIGWSGAVLAGFSIGSAVGAFVYGLRSWPGRLPTQNLVLLLGVSACVAVVAVLPGLLWIGTGLAVAGVMQAGAMLTRNLALRELLPPGALAAGYSVMYAAVGAGYAASGSLAGGLLRVVAPSTAILAGVCLTLLLAVVGAVGERRVSAGASGGARAGRVSLPSVSS